MAGFVFCTIMFLTHLKMRSLMTLVITMAVSAPLAWNYLLKDYQRARVTSFMDPENDLLGSGWHAYQAKVAIDSGGLTGKGYLQGTQNQHKFLPDQHSDFPFPVWAEEHVASSSVLRLLARRGRGCRAHKHDACDEDPEKRERNQDEEIATS